LITLVRRQGKTQAAVEYPVGFENFLDKYDQKATETAVEFFPHRVRRGK
jgi:hypothetical protein